MHIPLKISTVGYHTADRAAVTVDIFGSGVDDNVGSKLDRLYEKSSRYRIVDDKRKSMLMCQLCPCLNVCDIQLRIADRLSEDGPCIVGDCLFYKAEISAIHENGLDPESLQIMKQIDRSSVKARACDDLLSASYDI